MHSVSLEALARALDLIEPIGPEERAALTGLQLRTMRVAAGGELVRQGDTPTESCLLLDGFACRCKDIAGGQRQILSFHFPGDIPDLQGLHLERMDHSLTTLVESIVVYIPHDVLGGLMRNYPGLARALWRAALVDASILREWLAGVGRRAAAERMAHLFCEIYVRMSLLNLASSKSFYLPVTQQNLADALGLSAVHVNRTLQELRRQGLIAARGHFFSVEDWLRLKAFGDFDPLYLHLRKPLPPELA